MMGPMDDEDVAPRRTWLAAERTFLAWWRTGLAASVAALAVGRVLPEVVEGPTWPYLVLGLGYGAVAVGVFALGARRHHDIDNGLREGRFPSLGGGVVAALSLAGAALTIVTMAVIAIDS
jgi:putative membrane protein